ncbi:MAG: DinB family protein [Phycisphaerales bacterium]|nr:DinB family protein [Phycisphaerales bacterium]MCB9836112.1 DinB family protein [Phycisphaera sp.]
MAQSDPTEILLIHHRWANDRLLEACVKLADEQLDRAFEMGRGTLRKTLTHVAGAIGRWGDLLADRELRPMLDDQVLSIDELCAFYDEVTTDFELSVRRHRPEEIVSRELHGKSYGFTRGGVLTHVMTHGVHHRAQCLNMLRKLGVQQLPPVSVVEWMMMADPV